MNTDNHLTTCVSCRYAKTIEGTSLKRYCSELNIIQDKPFNIPDECPHIFTKLGGDIGGCVFLLKSGELCRVLGYNDISPLSGWTAKVEFIRITYKEPGVQLVVSGEGIIRYKNIKRELTSLEMKLLNL